MVESAGQPQTHRALGRWESITLAVVSAAGIVAFAYPFIVSAIHPGEGSSGGRSIDSALLLGIVVTCSLALALGELGRGSGAGSLSRSVALLGVLVAIDASLRLIPSFFGASPIFGLIVVVGAVFGSRFGFVMGALTLLLSAAFTAGIGPWLPFQMLCAGWVGLAAGWIPLGSTGRAQIGRLALFGGLAGLLYGALINLYAWPFAAPGVSSDAGLYWYPGLSLAETIQRYGAFYVTTSLLHDLSRAAGNILLILVAGGPVVRLLRRFRARTTWSSIEAAGS